MSEIALISLIAVCPRRTDRCSRRFFIFDDRPYGVRGEAASKQPVSCIIIGQDRVSGLFNGD
jgi:hypothetical protein